MQQHSMVPVGQSLLVESTVLVSRLVLHINQGPIKARCELYIVLARTRGPSLIKITVNIMGILSVSKITKHLRHRSAVLVYTLAKLDKLPRKRKDHPFGDRYSYHIGHYRR